MRKAFAIILCFLTIPAAAAVADEIRWGPKVVGLAGSAFVTDQNDHRQKIKPKMSLTTKAFLETESKSWLRIQLSEHEEFIMGPNSQVLLPVIHVEDGAVERIELIQGGLRLINPSSVSREVLTEVSRDPYSEGDFLFQYNKVTKRLNLSVFEGHALFRGLENDDPMDLTAGHQAFFQADVQEDQLVVDVLLQGRRVVRGHLSEQKKLDSKLKQEWLAAGSAKTKSVKGQSSSQDEIVAKGGAGGANICQKPVGRFNQCAWICDGNPKKEKKKCRVDLSGVQCMRTRCDANGVWNDATVIAASQSSCQAKPEVRACDY